jgi:hypothetical protein
MYDTPLFVGQETHYRRDLIAKFYKDVHTLHAHYRFELMTWIKKTHVQI